jgi:hypothetical protein
MWQMVKRYKVTSWPNTNIKQRKQQKYRRKYRPYIQIKEAVHRSYYNRRKSAYIECHYVITALQSKDSLPDTGYVKIKMRGYGSGKSDLMVPDSFVY